MLHLHTLVNNLRWPPIDIIITSVLQVETADPTTTAEAQASRPIPASQNHSNRSQCLAGQHSHCLPSGAVTRARGVRWSTDILVGEGWAGREVSGAEERDLFSELRWRVERLAARLSRHGSARCSLLACRQISEMFLRTRFFHL